MLLHAPAVIENLYYSPRPVAILTRGPRTDLRQNEGNCVPLGVGIRSPGPMSDTQIAQDGAGPLQDLNGEVKDLIL